MIMKKEFPMIQIALDFTELERALTVARESVSAGVTCLEAGTPLIKAEGLAAVRALKKEFPKCRIVADMKVMDTGRLEAEMAFKAGADVVVVMGNASEGTIKEAVDASLNYGGKVMVDLLEASATIKMAKRAAELGAHFIGVHIPIDKQMKGEMSLDVLKEIASVVSIPVAVAGGINSENVVDALKAGASIFIVGGAVTKSEDVKTAVKTIQEAIEKKKGIKTKLFKRVSFSEVRDVFLRVSTANISDALHRSGWLEGLLPVIPDIKMAGKVITVRTYPGDWAKPVEAIDMAEEGDVVVVDVGGVGPAVWGELATNSAVIKKVAGVVVYGGVRDVEEITRIKLPVFAKIICPEAGEPKGFGEINVPLRMAGYTVRPGDWIVGDNDGVVLIPEERVVETANRAMDVFERENRIRKEIRDGRTLSSVTDLLKWEKIKK